MDREGRARVYAALGEPTRLAIVETLVASDRTVADIGALVGVPGNLLAHHLDVLEGAGIIHRRTSEGDRRRRYVILDRSIASAVGLIESTAPGNPVSAPLFVCTHNSARSQYATALWEARTGDAVESAGTHPADRVHPKAIAVAADLGIDLSAAVPHGYGDVGSHDVVISVCDRAAEEHLPDSAVHLHWSIPDPVTTGTTTAFRAAFAEITERVDALLGERS